jgi:L-threonylcarbamoyladenylate synthase
VAFPTETVYGLGADAESVAALRRLYAVKGRPMRHPVIVHLPGPEELDAWAAAVPDDARRLVDAFWPGPLTVIVRRSERVLDEVTGGRDTVGLRVPDQPVARALLAEFGRGLAAPSANRFGRVSPTTAAAVRDDLDGDVDVVLDGGPCRIGVESTIVDCTGDAPVIARAGGIERAAVEAVVGPVDLAAPGTVAAPGTLAAHYAPRARVHLVHGEEAVAVAEALVDRGRRVGLLASEVLPGVPSPVAVLATPVDVRDYAHVLYARLREADARGVEDLLIVPPADDGLGAAIVDRLRRAAASGAS